MSEAPEEAEEFYKVAGALLINIGTLTKANEKDILEIGKIANKQGTPIVFDPIAVGASTYRKQFCETFLSEINVSVIKGNASEILTLVDSNTTMKGTDGETDLDVVTIAKKLMKNIKQQLLLQVEKMLLFKIIKLSNYQMVLHYLQKSQARVVY